MASEWAAMAALKCAHEIRDGISFLLAQSVAVREELGPVFYRSELMLLEVSASSRWELEIERRFADLTCKCN